MIISVIVIVLTLRSENGARKVGHFGYRMLNPIMKKLKKPTPDVEGALIDFRVHAHDLVTTRWKAITVANAVAQLTPYVVLVCALGGLGAWPGQLTLIEIFAAYSVALLLVSIPFHLAVWAPSTSRSLLCSPRMVQTGRPQSLPTYCGEWCGSFHRSWLVLPRWSRTSSFRDAPTSELRLPVLPTTSSGRNPNAGPDSVGRLVVGDCHATPECDAIFDLLRGILWSRVVPGGIGVDVSVDLDGVVRGRSPSTDTHWSSSLVRGWQ